MELEGGFPSCVSSYHANATTQLGSFVLVSRGTAACQCPETNCLFESCSKKLFKGAGGDIETQNKADSDQNQQGPANRLRSANVERSGGVKSRGEQLRAG